MKTAVQSVMVGLVRPGQRVGKYVLGDPIARGGMAEVWAARVEGPGGFVKSLALKFILESFTGDAELERLFVNEARVAAQLSHANLVSVFDFDELPGSDPESPARYYIAMERVDGHDLRRVLQVARHKGRRLPPETAVFIAGEVLKGLRYVHERRDEAGRPLGLVHRDVSPHNVLVGLGGEVKLSDFGIAKAMTQSLGTQSGTQSGIVRGKLAYASPEQLRSEVVDHRADQFGLGVTLWEMLADRRLFDGADEVAVVGKVLRCEIPPLPADRHVDPAVEAVVRRMLVGDAGGRFATTGQVLAAVQALPGCWADGAGLVDLMQDLFEARPVAMPPTVPLQASPGGRPAGGMAETKVMELDAQGAPADAAAEIVVPAARPVRLTDHARGDRRTPPMPHRRSAEQGIPVPVSEEPERAIPVPRSRERDSSDSGYVSGPSAVIPGWIDQPLGPPAVPAGKRRWWAIGAAGLAAIVGVTLWALAVRRAARPLDDADLGETTHAGAAAAAREVVVVPVVPVVSESRAEVAPADGAESAAPPEPEAPPAGDDRGTSRPPWIGKEPGPVVQREAPASPVSSTDGLRARRSGKRARPSSGAGRRDDVASVTTPRPWAWPTPPVAPAAPPVPGPAPVPAPVPAPGSPANRAPIFEE